MYRGGASQESLSAQLADEAFLARPVVSWSLIAAATVLGAFLRLHGLGAPSLWVDEFFTIGRAGVDPVHWTSALGYLPTRFTLELAGADLSRISLENITEWQALGVSERAARLGPCWVGIASIPILASLVRVAMGAAVAGPAALLLALLPFHIYWSQMARFYTCEFLFANAFLLLFVRGMQTGRTAWFAASLVSGLLAFASHLSGVFLVVACLGMSALAWLGGAPLPHLRRGVLTLGVTTALCALGIAIKELQALPGATLVNFAEQEWSPSVSVLVLGAILRFEPAICAVGSGALWVSLRRRDALGLLLGGIAVLVPLGVLALNVVFPVGPRYIFACAFAWILLASLWCVEVDRRLSAGGAVLGVTGLLVLLVSVGFNAYLYTRDGSGARERYRHAFEYVLQHGDADDPVFTRPGRFQAAYYLRRPSSPLPATVEQRRALPPGSWVVQRQRGDRTPRFDPSLELRERFEIPSKPWSWVLYVFRVRETAPEANAARHSE